MVVVVVVVVEEEEIVGNFDTHFRLKNRRQTTQMQLEVRQTVANTLFHTLKPRFADADLRSTLTSI